MNLYKMFKRDQKGFTLVELLVVVVILGILSTLAIQVVGDKTKDATLAKVRADLRTLASALEIAEIEGATIEKIEDLKPDYVKNIPTSPISDNVYALDTEDGYIVLCKDTDGDGKYDSSKDVIYKFTSTDYGLTSDWEASSENL